MLSSTDKQILEFLLNNQKCAFRGVDPLPSVCTEVRMEHLSALGFVQIGHVNGTACYILTPEGEDALSAHLQQCADRARDEADKHLQKELEHKRWRKDSVRSWVQWTVTTVLTLASFFAGAIAEMLTGFVEWIVAFFHP